MSCCRRWVSIRSDNPADWSAAALQCRNVVQELGRTLFPVDFPEYESKMLGKTLGLRGEREKNRLSAYIDHHWGNADEKQRKDFVRCSRLVESIYAKGSGGKRRVRRDEAQALVVDTFELVATLDDTTGLEPVVTDTVP